jgi:phosphate starvation-inducible PhoH-like protein
MTKGANNPKKTRRSNKEYTDNNVDTTPLRPMNEGQREYIRLLREKDMIIATGFAGTSKTFIPTVMACDLYKAGKIDKIVFTRPPLSNSKSLGFFAGDKTEKMFNWLAPVLDILKKRLGLGRLEIAVKHEEIVFMPLETIKGYSAENCYFIVDEAEDISIEEAKKIVTRQGKNCKMVLSGDVSQSELKDRSGLKWLKEMIEAHPELESSVGLIDFNRPDDIVRSDLCKKWILAIRREEKKGGSNG